MDQFTCTNNSNSNNSIYLDPHTNQKSCFDALNYVVDLISAIDSSGVTSLDLTA